MMNRANNVGYSMKKGDVLRDSDLLPLPSQIVLTRV
jgi:hypothetical protein